MNRPGQTAAVLLAAVLLPGAAAAQDAAPEPAAAPVAVAEYTPPPPDESGGELELFQLDEDLLTMTVTAVSKRAESALEAPATVAVLTREDFERYGWRNVAEALRSVPGLYVSWGRDYYYTGVRGISLPLDVDSRVLVLLDGHTMNNPWSAASNTGELATLPPQAVERIEVIRGPSSSIYGSNAFFAVVNIVSRRPDDKAPAHASAELYSDTGLRFRPTLRGHRRFANGLEVSAFGVGLLGNGPTTALEGMTRPRLNSELALPDPVPTTRRTDYERGYNVGALARWRELELQLQLGDRWKGLPTARGDSIFDDPYNSVADQHGFAEARWRRPIGDHELKLRAWYDRFRGRQYLHRDPTDWEPDRWTSPDPRTVSEGNDDTLGAEAQGTLALHARDTLVAGVELARHDVTQPTYELDPLTGAMIPETLAGGVKAADGTLEPIVHWNLAAYVQNDWRPIPKLGIVAGLRYDYNSLFRPPSDSALDALAPRAAVVWSATEWATFKATYGEAFRNPSVFEAFFDDGASVCGNPEARRERQRSAELSGSFRLGRGLSLTASGFYTRVNGLLVKVPVDSCYEDSGPRLLFQNRGAVQVFGGEAGLDVRLPARAYGFATVTLTRARQLTETKELPLPNSPVAVGALGAAIPLWQDKLVASAQLYYLSERLNWAGVDPQPGLEVAPEPGHLHAEAALLGKNLAGGLTAGLAVSNALNASWRDPVSSSETLLTAIPQEGIVVRAHVGYEL